MIPKINDAVEAAYAGKTGTPVGIPIAPTAAPTGLAATAGNGQVTLSWQAVSGATNYNVYRNGQRVNAQAIASISYTDYSEAKGTAYSYTVTAVNGVGESTQSVAVSATPLSAPMPPSNLYATVGMLRVTLDWEAPALSSTASPPTSYRVYRGGTLLASGLTDTVYTDLNVTTGYTYPYTVTSVSTYGESAMTTSISAVPAPPDPGGTPPPSTAPDVKGIKTVFTDGLLTRVQETDSLGGAITQSDLTWTAGELNYLIEVDELGAKHRLTLNYVNGELDPVNPITRTVEL